MKKNYYFLENEKYLRGDILLKILIFLIWFSMIFASESPDNKVYKPVGIDFTDFFNSTSFFFISPFEMIVLFFIIVEFLKKVILFKSNNIIFFFLLLNFFFIILNYINPNNAKTDFIIFLMGKGPRLFYFTLFISTIFLLSEKKNFLFLFSNFLFYGNLVLLIKLIQSFFYYITGNGYIIENHRSILVNGNILVFTAFFQIINLGYYFDTKKKKFLFLSVFYFIVLLLSFRRTSLLTSFLASFSIIMTTLKIKLRKKILIILIVILLLAFSITPLRNSVTFLRTMGAFSYFENPYSITTQKQYNDSGHWQQTIMTLNTMLSNLRRFWGAGYKNETFYVEGQSTAIHNSVVWLWAQYGLHASLIFLILFILSFFIYINTILNKKLTKIAHYHVILASFIFILIYFVGCFFHPGNPYFNLSFFFTFIIPFSTIRFLKFERSDKKEA